MKNRSSLKTAIARTLNRKFNERKYTLLAVWRVVGSSSTNPPPPPPPTLSKGPIGHILGDADRRRGGGRRNILGPILVAFGTCLYKTLCAEPFI
jgi:hypothetical protein